jgi:hypothetical protein
MDNAQAHHKHFLLLTGSDADIDCIPPSAANMVADISFVRAFWRNMSHRYGSKIIGIASVGIKTTNEVIYKYEELARHRELCGVVSSSLAVAGSGVATFPQELPVPYRRYVSR